MLGGDHRAVMAHTAPELHPGPHGAPVAMPAGTAMRLGPWLGALSVGALSLGILAASTSGAVAVEWIVGGSVSQRLEADSNPDLDEDGDAIYGGTTALGLDFTALTPTTQLQIETGASVEAFGGPGDTEGLNGAFPNFAAAVSHDGKYVDTGASFAFDMQPVTFAQLDETGVTDGDATQVSVRLAADAAYALDPRNRLSVGGSGRIIRFTSGTTSLDPNTSYGANLAWIRSLGPATQGSLTAGLSRFTAESDENPDSVSFDLSAGIDRSVNRRLSYNASLGFSATRTTRTLAGQPDTDFSVGATGGLQVAWQPQPDTQLVFALSHGLEPSSLGELQTTTALGAGLQHSINSWADAAIDVLVQRQTSGGGFEGDDDTPRIYASISPSVAFSLTPDWALRAGYAYSLQRETGADAASNRVFLTLTRQFDILP